MKIELKELTTCGVTPDGEDLEISFVDATGTPVSLQVPFDCAQAIAMTLPQLLTRALRKITGKREVRYVFPLGSWCLQETGDRDCLIATFATEDGFEVSFGIPFDTCRSLGWALKDEADQKAPSEGADRTAATRDPVLLN